MMVVKAAEYITKSEYKGVRLLEGRYKGHYGIWSEDAGRERAFVEVLDNEGNVFDETIISYAYLFPVADQIMKQKLEEWRNS